KNRFRNRNELKYSMRSIHCFMPWVNHIYIVTFGQTPQWLKNHPKVTIVDHKEIFKNPNDLPTFNSHAIEANLHHIPGLSERYIYFNDDVFVADIMKEEDFFTRKGKIKVALGKQIAQTGAPIAGESAYNSAWKNTNQLLDIRFEVDKRRKLAHTPFAFKKSVVQEIEKRCLDVFQTVSSHKFRVPTDYTITNGLIQYYAYYLDEAVLDSEAYMTVRVTEDLKENEKIFQKVGKTPLKFFCVQDITLEDNATVDVQVQQFFNSSFPFPAPWEKVEEGKG
ncbi:MAG TPA: stealth conserved region 3 domain-containing protein, partial [Chlamydiales bacterium]|nr:stealth conserved region 3 domain-containing protein [Chlamydiales bacterium]